MKTILYLFDDINYQSGAQKVTFFQMKMLSHRYKIHAFSLSRPLKQIKKQIEQHGSLIIGEEIWEKSELFSYALKTIFYSKEISFIKKIQRVFYSVFMRIGKGDSYLDKLIYQKMKQKFEEYDAVIVVSEASKLRRMVTRLEHPKKIQWIHTDYALWSEFSDWTRMITRNDTEIYAKFDRIVVLSEYSKKGFLKKLPQVKDKTIVIPNLIDGETILRKSQEEFCIEWEEKKIHLVTVGRTDKEKGYDRILDICGKLKEKGYSFCWYIVGDGPQKGHLEKRILAEKLTEQVKLLGRLENPYPLMKRCDWFVLLSEYEGTPVTIDEAMILGVPVIALDIGGIAEQMKRGTDGYLIAKSKSDKRMYGTMKKLEKVKKQFDYQIWNKSVLYQIEKILG